MKQQTKQKKKSRYRDPLACDELRVFRARSDGALLRKRKRPSLIDLFSGAGGMSLGFSNKMGHCCIPIWANDIDPFSVESYNENFGQHCQLGDLNEILEDKRTVIPKADIVIGGPPCQGFSLLNKNREGDSRKQLWRPFLEVVRRSGATIFVMENVPQLINSNEHEQICEVASNLGFETHHSVLCAADYGVPQKRFRAFILGCNYLHPNKIFPPKRTHFDANNGFMPNLPGDLSEHIDCPEPWITVRGAIGDLAPPNGTEMHEYPPPNNLHFRRNPTELSLKRYRAIPKEGMNRFDLYERAPELTPPCWVRKKSGGTDLFGRLWWDKPAFTIRTEFFKPEKGRYLHPVEDRPITHREAARFQGFPDDFIFIGSKVETAKQIGNAVPPPLAARVADCVYSLWLAKP